MNLASSAAQINRLFSVAGRSYVVTGAASGIGRAIAEGLAANGARLLLLDRDASALAALASRLGTGVSSCALDVADLGTMRSAFDGFVAPGGTLDGVFANAGISGGAGYGTSAGAESGRLEAQDPDHWERVLQVNLFGVLNALKLSVPVMKRAGRGSVVVTASIGGLQAEPFVSYSYAAAKAAVVQMVRQAALELAPSGIRVNGIAPGFLRTGIAGGRLHDPMVEAELARRIPMGRLGAADDVQGVALLLASDAGSYVTGSIFPVDGGALLGARVAPLATSGAQR